MPTAASGASRPPPPDRITLAHRARVGPVIEPDRIYDLPELGVLLDKRPQSILNDRYEGRPSPPAIRIGRKLRYRGQDVLDWLAAHRER